MKDETHPTLPHQVDRIVAEVKTQKISDEKLLSDYAVPTQYYVDGNEDTELPQLVGIDAPLTFRSVVDYFMAKVAEENKHGSADYFSENKDRALYYASRTGDSTIAFQIMEMINAKDKNVFVSPEILVNVWEACQNHAYRLKTSGDTEKAINVLHEGINLWQNQLEKLPLGSRLGRMLNRVANAQVV